MRKLPLIISGLLFALPAAAQESEPSNEPQDKVEVKESAPAVKPEATNPSTPAVEAAPPPPPAPAKAVAVSNTTTVSGPAVVANDDSWKFEYHGYIRAPMRVGIGNRDKPTAGSSRGTSFHSPIIPDDQYLSWQSSPHNKTDWAELFLSLGNSWAKGTVSIQGYNFAEAAWSNPTTQLGISDGYVDLTPDLGYENFRLAWRVGAFSNKYGSAGKYDAGEYDTYMFGRIHNAGEALHAEYDLDEQNTFLLEHGIGFRKPDPSQYNNTRFTMLNHAHVTFKHTEAIQISAHYLNSWTTEEERSANPGVGVTADGASAIPYTIANPPATSITNVPDGRMWIAGLDARLDLGAYGYFYGAYSHVGLKNAITVDRAIEVIHASGGGEFGLGVVDNYLGPSCVDTQFGTDNTAHGAAYYPQPGIDAAGNRVGDAFNAGRACSMGNGSVDTLLGQYEFSLTNFTQQSSGGQKFWGDGSDLYLKLYGMYNKVKSDYGPNDGIHKLKFGADLAYSILPWLTAAVRFDRLQPNNKIPEQSFGILSPRLVFKSKWNTHEAITIQYSRYLYNQRECAAGNPNGVIYTPGQELCVQPPSSAVPPDGYGSAWPANAGQRGAPNSRPDVNVFKIEATMWW
ncbi:MAG: hypothetical protein ABI488_04100 [Polyangiaceae bacterium]